MMRAGLLNTLPIIALTSAEVDYAKYVNPFIGSEGPIPGWAYGGGDIFVGGAVPFGVVKLGIDTVEQNRSIATVNGGYTPKGDVTGVSMLHVSGTGGCPKYGLWAQRDNPALSIPNLNQVWCRKCH